ncbi:MAG: cytochrome-c peroxidase, partial [Ignavibacteria bacterium]|nr:cytochrome-c peroxidase [Ignavibacteria bacterium]
MIKLKKFYFHVLFITSLLMISIPFGCNSNEGEETKVKLKDKGTNIVESDLNAKEQLGKLLFFEKSLSTPPGQACSDCHAPEVAFADPETELPVSRGAHPDRYGNRNDMTVSYSAFVPPLHFDTMDSVWVGGLFWDGRANSLAEQSKGPPLNPLEMANPDTLTIFEKLKSLSYAALFIEVYG